jgi:hypothetical protein
MSGICHLALYGFQFFFQRLAEILRVTFRVPEFVVHFKRIAELKFHIFDVFVAQGALLHGFSPPLPRMIGYRQRLLLSEQKRTAYTTKYSESQAKKNLFLSKAPLFRTASHKALWTGAVTSCFTGIYEEC